MKLDGAQVIAADRMTVWHAINDPEILKQCIPGCEEMSKTSPTSFEAVVVQKVGPVKATFRGAVSLEDIVEGESLTLRGEGKGGVAGMAKGDARVRLVDAAGGGTELSYEADASVAGKIAQLGSRLIDGVAQRMANGFFDNFREAVESGDRVGNGASAGIGEPGAGDIDGDSVAGGTTANDVWQSARDIATHSGGAAAGAVAAGGAAVAAAAASAGDTAGSVSSSVSDKASDVVAGARDAISGGIEGAKDAAGNAVSGARDAAASVGGSAADVVAQAKDTVAGGIGKVSDVASDVGAGARDAAGNVADAASNAAGGAADAAGDAADWTKGAAVAAAGGVGAVVTGLAAKAGDKLDGLHELARDSVIDAGKDIDEDAEWKTAKEHAGVAADEAGDAIGDAWDAAKAKAQGATELAAQEWNEAKTNAGQAAAAAGAAGSAAWQATKGEAADIAENPRIGPKGKPWYLWIILAIIVALLVWWFL